MPNRVTSSSVDQNVCIGPTQEAEQSGTSAAVAPKSSESAQNSCVDYGVSREPVASSAPASADGPTCSPQELERQQAAQRKWDTAINALTNNLRNLVAVVDASNGNPGTYNTALLTFAVGIEKDADFKKMLATFSREEISEALLRLARDAAPRASEAEVRSVRDRLVSEIDQRLLVTTSRDMQRAAVAKLNAAASNFEKTASDPQALRDISNTLNRLEAPSATAAQRAQAAMLRGALGLENDARPVNPFTLQAALQKQAALIRHEASRVSTAGENTLYRSLLVHSKVDAGPRPEPGSWADNGVRNVLARGHSDEETIKAAKMLTAVALGAASGGMGLGTLVGMGATALSNAVPVLNAWMEIDHARAGVSAGTADSNAAVAAERKAWLETAEAAAAIGTAGVLGAHAGLLPSATLDTSSHVVVTAAKDAASELVINGAAVAAEHITAPEAAGAKGDAVSRARDAAN